MLILKKAERQSKTPHQSKKKMIYQGQNLGHRKFPVFMLFFLKQPKSRGKLIFLSGWGGGEGHYTAHKPSELNRILACG